MLKIAVLASGGGTDFQSIIDASEAGNLPNVKIEMLIASKAGIGAIDRAEKHGIETHVVSKKEFKEKTSDEVLKLVKGKADLIVLAGYLGILQGEILKEFENKIINIHPSLIPSFCGPGMYGMHVHEAVIKSGVRYSGCTVHFVNGKVDGGAIILQDAVDVKFEDDAETLQKRILEREHKLLPKAVKLLSEGKVEIVDGRVKIN